MGRESGAKASVFYGITASAGSVYAAIAAWPQVEGPLRFIDLILNRRRKGTLRSSSPTSRITSIPPELWRQVLGDVVSAEVTRAGLELLEGLFCLEHQIGMDDADQSDESDQTDQMENVLSWEDYYRVMQGCYKCGGNWIQLGRDIRRQVSR